MGEGEGEGERAVRRGDRDPWIAAVLATGGVLAVMLVGEAVVFLLGLRPIHDAYAVGALSSLVPILWLFYGGHRVASGPLPPARYRRVAAWCLGAGVAFLGLNLVIMASIPPESTMQTLAWMRWAVSLGAGAGLLVGIFEARAIERARSAERLSVERREADRRNDVLEEFASVVSHDLRNPLNVALGRLDLVRDAVDDGGDGAARTHIDDVEAALERMASIIDETLVLAREGQTVGSSEAVSVAEVARSSWDVVETRDAELALEDPPTVEADPSRLRHVLENLFRNAVEHGGREVTVRVGALPDGEGFYVEDDGEGFDGVEGDGVFEPGFTTSREGTGLGLSIVKRIAEAHGWTVRATAGATGGARFEITGIDQRERPRASAPA